VETFSEEFNFMDFDKLENKWKSYEGNFVQGKFQGNGKLKLNNGEEYIGSFKNGKVHGSGTYIKKDKK